MKTLYAISKLISKYETELSGIYTLSDLQNLLNDFNKISLYRKIKKLEDN